MSDPSFHIETPRLYIAFFQPSLDTHCDFLVQLYNTPLFLASNGGRPSTLTSRAVARERISTLYAQWYARNGYGQYLVALKPSHPADADAPFQEKLARCKLIGNLSLMRGDSPTAYTAPDVGFLLLPEETRKGYGKEATGALLEYAKRELGVDVVFGFTDPTNEASQGLFRSLGFEDRGVKKLAEFGGEESSVWITPGASEDLSVYNLK